MSLVLHSDLKKPISSKHFSEWIRGRVCDIYSVLNRPGAPQGRRGKRQEGGTEHDRTGPLAVVGSRARHPEGCRGRLGPPGPIR